MRPWWQEISATWGFSAAACCLKSWASFPESSPCSKIPRRSSPYQANAHLPYHSPDRHEDRDSRKTPRPAGKTHSGFSPGERIRGEEIHESRRDCRIREGEGGPGRRSLCPRPGGNREENDAGSYPLSDRAGTHEKRSPSGKSLRP